MNRNSRNSASLSKASHTVCLTYFGNLSTMISKKSIHIDNEKRKELILERYWSCDAEYFPRLTAFTNVNVEQEGLIHAYSLLVRISKASPASKEDNWVPFLLSSFIASNIVKGKITGLFLQKAKCTKTKLRES